MLSSLRAPLLIASFALASSAQAQFRPVEIPATPMVPAMPAPMPNFPTLMTPNLAAPIWQHQTWRRLRRCQHLSPQRPRSPHAPRRRLPPVMVPGCPGRADCPPEPEGEGPLSEAAKEILKEFAKCAAEGKPFDQCLLDDPPPPTLTGLGDDERVQLTICLGSNDLNASESLWNGCVARVR